MGRLKFFLRPFASLRRGAIRLFDHVDNYGEIYTGLVMIVAVIGGLVYAGHKGWLDPDPSAQAAPRHIMTNQEYFGSTNLLQDHPVHMMRELRLTTGSISGDFTLGTGPLQGSVGNVDVIDFDVEVSGIIIPFRNIPLTAVERRVVEDDKAASAQFIFKDRWLAEETIGQPPKDRLGSYIDLGNSERSGNVRYMVLNIPRSKISQLYQQ